MRKIVERFLPPLYFNHRGFFLVAVGLLWTHLWAGLDEALPYAAIRHNYAAWELHNEMLPHPLWAVFHLLMALAMAVGIGAKGEPVAIRIVCAISATLFGAMLISFAYSVLKNWPYAPLTLIGFAGLAVATAAAALLEPPENPANIIEPRK